MASRCLSLLLCIALCLPAGWAAGVPPASIQEAAIESGGEVPADATMPSPDVAKAVTDADAGAQPLTPEEEEELGARAEEPGAEVAGGALSNQHLTYAVIALAAIALVLIFK